MDNNSQEFIQKRKIEDLYISSEVVTDVCCDFLQHITIPFVDYFISTDVKLSVVNFTTNNLIAIYEPQYGEIPPEKYKVQITIPALPDEDRGFNEFYLNFIVLDGLKLETDFYVFGNWEQKIEGLPSMVIEDMTFHFHEDLDGNYDVDWKSNYNASLSGLIQELGHQE